MIIDIEARGQKFIEENIKNPQFKFLDVPLESLNTIEGATALFNELEVTPDPLFKYPIKFLFNCTKIYYLYSFHLTEIMEIVGKKLNQRLDKDNGVEDIAFYEDQIA